MTIEGVRNECVRYFIEHEGVSKRFAVIGASRGVWTSADVEKYAHGSIPALYVATLGVEGVREDNGSLHGDVKLGLYILARASEGDSAENVALSLVHAIATVYRGVSHQDFVNRPRWDDGSNLFSGSMREIDLALWGVKITQRAYLHVNTIPTIGDIQTTT